MNNLNSVKKQHPNIFSDKEKEILLNHLVLKGDSCKKILANMLNIMSKLME